MNTLEQKNPGIVWLLSVTVLLILTGCAQVPLPVPCPPLGHQEIGRIVSVFRQQETAVHTLFSSGGMTLKGQGSESEATVLIVATRNPPKIKVEITHPWGRPLLHILINGSSLDILSFSEKRVYSGTLGNLPLSKLIPVPLSPELLWTLSRAYPALLSHYRVISQKGNQITLLDRRGDQIQVIDLYPDSGLPQSVSFCKQNAVMSFSDFQSSNGISFAGKTGLDGPRDGASLALDIRQMVFNKPVPEEIFRLKIPRDFEVVSLANNGRERD
ncbi:MAG: hypothetical protein H8E10_12715 [Desulfobacterales bacterium]|nr:hypothetical protein [Desulfobacterales bacterium]